MFCHQTLLYAECLKKATENFIFWKTSIISKNCVTIQIVPRIANCGKKVYIYILQCHMVVNETILKTPESQ